jgi:hypothetical protein
MMSVLRAIKPRQITMKMRSQCTSRVVGLLVGELQTEATDVPERTRYQASSSRHSCQFI